MREKGGAGLVMDTLFDLTFYFNDDDYEGGFHIGLFATREEAEAVAARYISEVPGFKDYDCTPGVIAFPVIGGMDHTTQVYRFLGWNINEDLDEIDILISSCFADQNEAEKALFQAKEITPREEWALNRHTIGQCDWMEGFVRTSTEEKV